MLKYDYLLERGEKSAMPAMKETDLHVRLKMQRNEQPVVRLGKGLSKVA